jgi:hypothetical protein
MAAATAEAEVSETTAETQEWPYRFEIVLLNELAVDEGYQRPLTNFWEHVRDNFQPGAGRDARRLRAQERVEVDHRRSDALGGDVRAGLGELRRRRSARCTTARRAWSTRG